MPLISVIIPTYNSARFLSRTIESVLRQTWQHFELIIVDDASTDGTIDVVRAFAEKDHRIKFVALDKNTGGPVRPTNKGLEMAQGAYIAFLDHDDEWLPEKLDEQLLLLRSSAHTLGGVVCDVLFSSEDKPYRFPEYPTKESSLIAMLCADFFFNFSILLIPREVFENVGFLDENFTLGADHDYYLRIARSYQIGVVRKPLLRYTIHVQNLSRSALSMKNSIADLELLLDKHSDLFARYPECHCHRLIQLGSAWISVGNGAAARSALRKAFGIDPFKPSILSYYLLSFLGKGAHGLLKQVRIKFK